MRAASVLTHRRAEDTSAAVRALITAARRAGVTLRFDAEETRKHGLQAGEGVAVDVPLSHPIYHAVYDFPKGLPKIHEHDGKPARGFGIFLGDRLAVYYSYSSDLGNGWEDPETYHDPPALHEAALRMGINLFVYAVTSRPLP